MSNKPKGENLLDFVPVKNEKIPFSTDENGKVTLAIENKGLFNKIAQKIFKKPKISYIHMEEIGSFIWLIIDGKKDIEAIGKYVSKHFGDKAEPLYERLSKYVQIMESYGFIKFEN